MEVRGGIGPSVSTARKPGHGSSGCSQVVRSQGLSHFFFALEQGLFVAVPT